MAALEKQALDAQLNALKEVNQKYSRGKLVGEELIKSEDALSEAIRVNNLVEESFKGGKITPEQYKTRTNESAGFAKEIVTDDPSLAYVRISGEDRAIHLNKSADLGNYLTAAAIDAINKKVQKDNPLPASMGTTAREKEAYNEAYSAVLSQRKTLITTFVDKVGSDGKTSIYESLIASGSVGSGEAVKRETTLVTTNSKGDFNSLSKAGALRILAEVDAPLREKLLKQTDPEGNTILARVGKDMNTKELIHTVELGGGSAKEIYALFKQPDAKEFPNGKHPIELMSGEDVSGFVKNALRSNPDSKPDYTKKDANGQTMLGRADSVEKAILMLETGANPYIKMDDSDDKSKTQLRVLLDKFSDKTKYPGAEDKLLKAVEQHSKQFKNAQDRDLSSLANPADFQQKFAAVDTQGPTGRQQASQRPTELGV